MKKILITAGVCAFITAVLTVLSLFDFGYREIVYTAVSIALFVIGSLFLKALTPKIRFNRFLRLYSPKKGDLRIMLSMTLLVISGGFLFNLLSIWLLGLLDVSVQAGSLTALDTDSFWLSLVTVAVVPAIFEELFFRGAVLSSLSKENTVAAVMVSALFFALVHGTLYYFLSNFYAGLIFAVMVYITNSVFASIAVHFLNNVLSYLLFVYSNRLTVVGLDGFVVYLLIFVFIGSLYLTVSAVAKKYSAILSGEKHIVNEGEKIWQKEQEKQMQDK